ncbi:hypothetical protein HID58_056834 [Brassica napus]|uniref:FAD-binding PCMH-type domain-containing protein n=1 Tax=Brassica napus TaxID=3708 RepID=A0ABQ8APC2_BRANA|nr:hypothetical protein HID58_056834 [Brassica napus]
MLTTRPSFVFFLLFLSLPLSSFSQPSNPVYNSFLKCFSEKTETSQAQNVFSQSNPSFSSVLRAYIRNARFNTSSTPKPTLIITPRSYSHVSAAVLCSKPLNFVFKIRSGGHDYDGLSYVSDKPFFVLDLSNLRDVTVNIADQTAWISAGATLGEFMESGAVDMVHKWQSVGPRTDRNLFLRMLLQPVTRNTVQTVRATAVALFLGRADDVVSLLRKELPELALKKENCTEMTWFQSALWWDNRLNATQIDPKVFLDRNLDSSRFLKRKSDYVATEIPRDGIESLFKKMIELGKVGLVFNPYGGKMAEIAEDATPLPHRKMLFKIQYSVNWQESSPEIEMGFLNQSRVLHSFMTQFVSKNPRRAYLNYRDVDIGVNDHGPNSYEEGEVYGRMYFGKNFDRLVKIKTAVDPGNFFRNEQSIPTLPSKA